MTRIIIAGDSWGAHSYERNYVHNDLEGFKWKPSKKYVLYPGPGDFLSKLTDYEVVTIADHGVSNTEALDNLDKLDCTNDIVVFYKTGLLREVYKAYLDKTKTHNTKDCKADFEHYSEKFYKRCATIKAKHFCLIGGCSEIQMDQAKKYNINILEQSVTKWLMPEADFTDNIFDPTVYWLEYQYKCDYFKKAVVQSYDKIQFWNTHTTEFCKKHPTVQSNKKIANRIYEYVTDKLD